VHPDCVTPNVGSVGSLPALSSLLAGCPQHCDDLLQIVGEPIMTTIGGHSLRKRPYEVTYDQVHRGHVFTFLDRHTALLDLLIDSSSENCHRIERVLHFDYAACRWRRWLGMLRVVDEDLLHHSVEA